MTPPAPPPGCQTDAATAPSIEFIAARNVLRLVVRPPLTAAAALRSLPATLDVGARGRLLGIELPIATAPELAAPWRAAAPVPSFGTFDPAAATLYLTVDDAEPASGDRGDLHARSVTALLRVIADAAGALVAVEVPRRGPGWLIAYPAGNR